MSPALISWSLLQFIVCLITWSHNLMLSILFHLVFFAVSKFHSHILVRKYHCFNCCVLCCCSTTLVLVILSKFGVAFFPRININMDTDISLAIFTFSMSVIFSSTLSVAIFCLFPIMNVLTSQLDSSCLYSNPAILIIVSYYKLSKIWG